LQGSGLQVALYVILCHSNQNEFEVAVEKENGKFYFSDGLGKRNVILCDPFSSEETEIVIDDYEVNS